MNERRMRGQAGVRQRRGPIPPPKGRARGRFAGKVNAVGRWQLPRYFAYSLLFDILVIVFHRKVLL